MDGGIRSKVVTLYLNVARSSGPVRANFPSFFTGLTSGCDELLALAGAPPRRWAVEAGREGLQLVAGCRLRVGGHARLLSAVPSASTGVAGGAAGAGATVALPWRGSCGATWPLLAIMIACAASTASGQALCPSWLCVVWLCEPMVM